MKLTMPTEQEIQAADGLAAQIVQVMPWLKKQLDKIKPIIDQPIIRFPWNLPLITSQVVAAGGTGVRLPSADFNVGLEYPFEVHNVKLSQDPGHTLRDWRLNIADQTFSQDMQLNNVMAALLVKDNTGMWELDPYPWIVRPKGGGLNVSVDNLDAVNPITVDISFQGYLMIPR